MTLSKMIPKSNSLSPHKNKGKTKICTKEDQRPDIALTWSNVWTLIFLFQIISIKIQSEVNPGPLKNINSQQAPGRRRAMAQMCR